MAYTPVYRFPFRSEPSRKGRSLMSCSPPSSRPPAARRSLLRWLGLGALGAAVVRPAAAFQIMPSGDYATMVETSCGNSLYHRRLLENAQARLGVSLSETQMSEALAALRCPTCGCPLVAAAAPAERGAPATATN